MNFQILDVGPAFWQALDLACSKIGRDRLRFSIALRSLNSELLLRQNNLIEGFRSLFHSLEHARGIGQLGLAFICCGAHCPQGQLQLGICRVFLLLAVSILWLGSDFFLFCCLMTSCVCMVGQIPNFLAQPEKDPACSTSQICRSPQGISVVWGIASLLSKEQGLKVQVSVVYCSSNIRWAQDEKALVSSLMLCFSEVIGVQVRV